MYANVSVPFHKYAAGVRQALEGIRESDADLCCSKSDLLLRMLSIQCAGDEPAVDPLSTVTTVQWEYRNNGDSKGTNGCDDMQYKHDIN